MGRLNPQAGVFAGDHGSDGERMTKWLMAARLTLTDRREGKVSEAAMFQIY